VIDSSYGDGVVLSVGSINADVEMRVAQPPRLGLTLWGSKNPEPVVTWTSTRLVRTR
jgi:hypothetical protein